MLRSVGITLGLDSSQYWIAQMTISHATIKEDAALIFSGSQGFLVLIAGLVLAFAFQLLLTNFFIALGISYSYNQSDADSDNQSSGTLDNTINQVGTIVGLRTLGTASITLFIACFLAVKLCPVNDAVVGAVLGLLIWAAYFSLLVWVSVATVGSVLGSVVNTATSGMQGILGTAAVAFGAKTVSEQVVSTAQAAATTVRRELSTSVDINSSHVAIDNYLKQLRLPEADIQEIQAEFEKLVAEPEMKSIASNNHLQNISRQTFVDLVSSRTDFPKEDINQAFDQFEVFWQQIWGKQQQKDTSNGLINYLQSAQPEELKSSQLTTQLEQLIEQTRKHQAQQQAEATQKVASTAAWWLFGTATASAIASTLAGAISVKG
ncbi:MAG: hypothetical protein JO235_22825 [Chroococcidiopsidaceae cyanobacterium CP_BM_RX_35]|nr:hypothetical protein [Chroococcidiopsidaceae cyanobacterium CP_BM_RX_35]